MSAQTSPVARHDSRTQTNVVVWAAISTVGVLLAGVVLLIALSLLSWATDRPVGSTAGSASQVALQGWYLAHSVALPASWGSLSVPPLLVSGFIALLFYRSGRGAVRACTLRTPAQIAEALAAVVISYVTCAVLLSSLAYPAEPMLSIPDIVIGTGTLSLVASLAGLLRESGLGTRLVALLPGPSYAYARGALAACWTLGGMSAVALTVSLLINHSETSALTAALSPNGLGGLTVIAISIAYLPNAMLLATALGTGAGFTLGDGSLYSLTTVDREALPIFPLFAALPHEAGGLVLLSVLVPLAAAVVGALTMTRHLEPEHRTAMNLLIGSLLSSVLTALGMLGVALFAAGGLGDGRLNVVGAAPWRAAGFLAVGMTVVVAITAFIATRRSMKPVSVSRRQKALSVLETGAGSVGAKGQAVEDGTPANDESAAGDAGSEVVELEPDSATRPVIVSKLAMRRLARGGKRTAKSRSAAAIKQRPTAAPKTAPAASLSVVKRARAAAESGPAKAKPAPTRPDGVKPKPATKPTPATKPKPGTQSSAARTSGTRAK